MGIIYPQTILLDFCHRIPVFVHDLYVSLSYVNIIILVVYAAGVQTITSDRVSTIVVLCVVCIKSIVRFIHKSPAIQVFKRRHRFVVLASFTQLLATTTR